MALSARAARPEYADRVFLGGRVHVLDAAGTTAQALAVARGRIVRVGADAEVAGLIGPATDVVELAGRALLPGINDSHLHGAWFGARWPHTFFGVPQDGAEGVGGVLAADRAARRDAILKAGGLLAERGITSYTEPGIGPGEDAGETGCFGSEVLDVYRELAAEGALKQRVTLLGLYGILDGPSDLATVRAGIAELVRAQGASDPRWLRIAGLKIFGDLIPLSRHAWTERSYVDGTHGGLLVEGETIERQAADLREMILEGHRAGLQVGVHATGDRTVQLFVDAVSDAEREPGAAPAASLGHVVIHGDLATAEQIRRMAELGMWFNAQAGIAAHSAEWTAQAIGRDVVDEAWRLRDALEAGVLVLSSDAPILDPDWRQGIVDAESRMLHFGAPSDPASSRHRLFQMLRAYTAVPAAQDAASGWKGTLEAGKVADLVVLVEDPLEAGVALLPKIDVDLTVVDGEVVFDRRAAASRGSETRPSASRAASRQVRS